MWCFRQWISIWTTHHHWSSWNGCLSYSMRTNQQRCFRQPSSSFPATSWNSHSMTISASSNVINNNEILIDSAHNWLLHLQHTWHNACSLNQAAFRMSSHWNSALSGCCNWTPPHLQQRRRNTPTPTCLKYLSLQNASNEHTQKNNFDFEFRLFQNNFKTFQPPNCNASTASITAYFALALSTTLLHSSFLNDCHTTAQIPIIQ